MAQAKDMTTAQVLREARALIEREGWGAHSAICRVTDQMRREIILEYRRICFKLLKQTSCNARTRAKKLKWFDRAIELAEKET